MTTRTKKELVEEAEVVVKDAAETVVKTVEARVDEAKSTVSKAVDKAVETIKEETVLDEFMAHQRRALEETGKALRALIPKAVEQHGKAAYKEAVEGYRMLVNSLVDEVIEAIEKIKVPEPEAPLKGRKPRDPKLN